MSYVEVAAQYAEDVLAGDVLACQHVKNACQRFADDFEKSQNGWKYHLDFAEADKWCRFLEKLPHTKGKWAAKQEKLILSPWQVFCTVNIFGWRREDNTRRFREVYIEVPRKSGKSLWMAGVGLGGLCIDDEYGAEIYSGATSEKQAHEVFRPARQICQRTPALCEKYGITVNAKTLAIELNGSRFEPLVGKPGDGASSSISIADEFHEHDSPDLVDTMVTGMGARSQPLMIYITTAGDSIGGPCYQKRAEVLSILNGTVEDDTIFGIVYTIDDEDDWTSEEALIKANPNYDVSVSADFLKTQQEQAKRSAIKQTAFKTKHLNQWVGARTAWMNMLAYERCRKNLSLEDFRGQRCFVGLDLASKVDVASMAILFPNGPVWTAFTKEYVPDAAMYDERADTFTPWINDGWMTATPGDIIDYEYIAEDLKEICREYDVVEVPYDPFQATMFSTQMSKIGIRMIEVTQNVVNFNEPMKHLEALVRDRKIEFSKNPVLRYMISNCVAKLDLRDRIYPVRAPGSRMNHIDSLVALLMAANRAMFWEREPVPYDGTDLFVVDL